MREPSTNDFNIELPEVGNFVFARRTMGDMINIRIEYVKLVGPYGDTDSELVYFGGFVAAYKILMVSCPSGWEDISAMDLNKVGVFEKIMELARLLREKESSFRGAAQS